MCVPWVRLSSTCPVNTMDARSLNKPFPLSVIMYAVCVRSVFCRLLHTTFTTSARELPPVVGNGAAHLSPHCVSLSLTVWIHLQVIQLVRHGIGYHNDLPDPAMYTDWKYYDAHLTEQYDSQCTHHGSLN